ncbi:MAG: hypothetical protein G01um101470_72 [Parcubacteria group bacterium Gr01-1014_70]|nr:MAG: hypothetical protein G01um101470_72 [Parcubacteria group bacterium Gr01-1014_70]
MATTQEQQYQAELLRQRQREYQMNIEEEQRETEPEDAEEFSEAQMGSKQSPPRKGLPISALEVGLWLLPAMTIDTFEFFGQTLAAIPVLGLPLAGASSVVGAIMSGIMLVIVSLWLFIKGVTPFTPSGMRTFLVLGGTAFGNAIVNWLPAWSGFFLWLFFMAHAREALFLGKEK